MKILKNTRLLHSCSVAATGVIVIFALTLSLTASAHAAKKKKTETLKEHFDFLYERFGRKTTGKIIVLPKPKAVKMRGGAAPGKQWTATSGLYGFKLTIQDKAECKIEKLVAVLEKLPASYMSLCAAVSGEGMEGVAVYADLGGTAARGGEGYLDILPTADPLAVARAMGRALAETASSKDKPILKSWAAAIKADKVSVSARGDSSCEEDIAQYAELCAVCLCARESWRFSELQRLSRKRFVLWIQMLRGPSPRPGRTPAPVKVSKEQAAEAKRLGVPVTFANSLGMQFVLAPAGKFMMGSRDPARQVARRCNIPQVQIAWFTDEHPRHEVTLNAFYMSVNEVAHWQYATLVKPNPDPRRLNWQIVRCPAEFLAPDKPAVFVGHGDSGEFFTALNRREATEGRKYSLPTEAQWEYACRAGGATPFSFGETMSTDQANYDGQFTYGDGKKGVGRGTTMPVGSLPGNAWGLHNMHGNVSEWCGDWYAAYTGQAETDPKGPEKQTRTREYVIRGGSWRSYPGACRSACRFRGSYYSFRKTHIGFRAVCALPARPEEKK